MSDFHPDYLSVAEEVGYSTSEKGDKKGVLAFIDKEWVPVRFDDLKKGDVFKEVHPHDGLISGEWRALRDARAVRNEKGREVIGVESERLAD